MRLPASAMSAALRSPGSTVSRSEGRAIQRRAAAATLAGVAAAIAFRSLAYLSGSFE